MKSPFPSPPDAMLTHLLAAIARSQPTADGGDPPPARQPVERRSIAPAAREAAMDVVARRLRETLLPAGGDDPAATTPSNAWDSPTSSDSATSRESATSWDSSTTWDSATMWFPSPPGPVPEPMPPANPGEPEPPLSRAEQSRINGARSHGPATPAGRAASSRNALKHGLTSRALLMPGESPAEYETLLDHLHEGLQPEGDFQLDLVRRLAEVSWRLRRLPVMEHAVLEQCAAVDPDSASGTWVEGLSCQMLGEGQEDVLLKLQRYEVRLERSRAATLRDLFAVQARMAERRAAAADARRAADFPPGDDEPRPVGRRRTGNPARRPGYGRRAGDTPWDTDRPGAEASHPSPPHNLSTDTLSPDTSSADTSSADTLLGDSLPKDTCPRVARPASPRDVMDVTRPATCLAGQPWAGQPWARLGGLTGNASALSAGVSFRASVSGSFGTASVIGAPVGAEDPTSCRAATADGFSRPPASA